MGTKRRAMGLTRKTGLKRTPMKSRPSKRDFSDARAKVEEEGVCRACGIPDDSTLDGQRVWLEAAHVIPRALSDEVLEGPRGGKVRHVPRDAVVPLCAPDRCHLLFDENRLDLLSVLTLEEQLFAVRVAGGIENARRKIVGGAA
jgi:hypothetical protein